MSFDLSSLIVLLLVDLVAGWLAGVMTKGRGFGLFGTIIVGLIGAVLGTWIGSLIGIVAVGLIGQILVAAAGAIILLVVLKVVFGKR